MIAKGDGVSFWNDKNVLKLIVAMIAKLYIFSKQLSCLL